MNCKIRLNIYLYKQTNKTKDSVKTKKKKNRTTKSTTYIPFPSVTWMSLADVNNLKVRNISIIPNDFGEVVLETDEERRSAAAAEVKNQWTFPSG